MVKSVSPGCWLTAGSALGDLLVLGHNSTPRRSTVFRHSSLTEFPDALTHDILCSTTSSVMSNFSSLFGGHILLSPTCHV
jgi:hypothetical protein